MVQIVPRVYHRYPVHVIYGVGRHLLCHLNMYVHVVLTLPRQVVIGVARYGFARHVRQLLGLLGHKVSLFNLLLPNGLRRNRYVFSNYPREV